MCGIAGEIACEPHSRVDADRALPMLQAILHRGPDDLGVWEDGNGDACFFHARLSLVDPAGGAQPMSDPAGRVVIAFNGEIYGFQEARRELEAHGVVFRTRSDTEVLLQLYLQSGPDFVRNLEGEFAFALLDRRNGQVMLARDRFGIKPLFVSNYNGLLLFGSEAKAILAHPLSKRQLDLQVLGRRLQGIFLPQETLFAGISAIEPGTYMLVSRGRTTSKRYADLDPEAAGTLQLSFNEAVDELESTLGEAVRQRFHGDSPVGIFLSGGVDSSSIASLARATMDKDLNAYSIDFARSGESEGSAAAETAGQLSIRHVRRKIDSEDLEAAFESSIWHSETVVANTHGTAKMLLARRAKHDVKAVLTGEGADELHGGYGYFQHAALIAAATEGDGQEPLARFAAQHGPRDGVLGAITPKLRRRLAWSNRGGTPYAAMRAVVAARGARLLTTADFQRQTPDKPEKVLLEWLSIRSPQARILDDATLSRFVAMQTDLPTYNLGYLGDRVEMANGLEARLPFLDSRVANLLWRMPAEFHLQNGENKRILRALLARTIPKVALKPKRAFLTPSTQSSDLMGGPLSRRWLSRNATRRAGIFKPGALAATQFLAAAASGNTPLAFYLSSYLTMAISAHLVIDLFCERFQENLVRRSAMSLDELRRRLDRDDRRLGASAA